jgi:hypothetical protein
MHWDLGTILQGAAVVALWLIHHSIKKPSDHERASLLAHLANDAAAVVLNLNPGATWAKMVSDTIAMLTREDATPTTDTDTLAKAAKGALARLGKTNDAAPSR